MEFLLLNSQKEEEASDADEDGDDGAAGTALIAVKQQRLRRSWQNHDLSHQAQAEPARMAQKLQ
jgi:hypothetical protein